MKSIIIISLLGVVASSYIIFKGGEKDGFIDDREWQLWKSGHNKQYADAGEEKVRYTIWKDNFQRIVAYNERSSNTLLAMNHFGDMTNLEFRSTMNGYFHTRSNRTGGSKFLAPNNLKLPDSVDWRDHGYVTPVKNQGHCGSCWAFSTTGSLEGQHFRKTGQLVELSEQNLVDCSKSYGNHGCQGGLMDNAFRYIKDNEGIDSEESYPYIAREERCNFKRKDVAESDTGFVDITEGDEDELKEAVASVGPVSVAIDASPFSFQFYKDGVYDEPECSPTKLDHGVLAVGYGTFKGKDYWLVKNSWGPSWGLDGFVRMSRNKDNQCGIASAASFPLV